MIEPARRELMLGAAALFTVPLRISAAPPFTAQALITAARKQIGVTTLYDGGYSSIPFPNGDVPRQKGACTDVVVRAYRDAFGIDLQALVSADMHAHFSAYPQRWHLPAPDRNIDHRRVPNLQTFFARMGAAVPMGKAWPMGSDRARWQPGDVFTCAEFVTGGTHIGIVSDRTDSAGNHLIIHNIGAGVHEEAPPVAYHQTGRFRYRIA
jgi:uncharacterized protein YijF (DUF1287 family)